MQMILTKICLLATKGPCWAIKPVKRARNAKPASRMFSSQESIEIVFVAIALLCLHALALERLSRASAE